MTHLQASGRLSFLRIESALTLSALVSGSSSSRSTPSAAHSVPLMPSHCKRGTTRLCASCDWRDEPCA